MSSRLAVHVTPKAGHDEIVGWRGAELSVRVTAAPEAGKANVAVCRIVARSLGVARSAVHVVRGDSSRHKILEIEGVTSVLVDAVFGRPGEALF